MSFLRAAVALRVAPWESRSAWRHNSHARRLQLQRRQHIGACCLPDAVVAALSHLGANLRKRNDPVAAPAVASARVVRLPSDVQLHSPLCPQLHLHRAAGKPAARAAADPLVERLRRCRWHGPGARAFSPLRHSRVVSRGACGLIVPAQPRNGCDSCLLISLCSYPIFLCRLLLLLQPSFELTVPAQWDDISGNNAHGRVLTYGQKPFLVISETGNGSTTSVTYVTGGLSSRVIFSVPYPSLFTLCTVTRFTSSSPPYGRIMTSTAGECIVRARCSLSLTYEFCHFSHQPRMQIFLLSGNMAHGHGALNCIGFTSFCSPGLANTGTCGSSSCPTVGAGLYSSVWCVQTGFLSLQDCSVT